jgi:hypothetical protein
MFLMLYRLLGMIEFYLFISINPKMQKTVITASIKKLEQEV